MSEAVQNPGDLSGEVSETQTVFNTQTHTQADHLFPLSFGQQRLWLLDQLTPDMPTYNVPICLQLSGPLNLDALQKSLQQVIQRHQILRTTFPALDGQPTQSIAPELAIPITLVDLQTISESQEERLQSLIQEEINTPFDLRKGPLFRATLFQLKEQEQILLFNIHHISFDGWSESLLFQELTTTYKALCENTTPSLPVLKRQYSDYVSWQRSWLQGDQLQKLLSYWKKELDGIPPLLPLPTDYPRPGMQSFHGARAYFQCPAIASITLQKLRKQEGVTLFMVLLSAWQTLLYRYTRHEDICIGTSAAGRTEEDFEEVIGFFVNTLVLRGRLHNKITFRNLLRQVRETSLDAYEHQNLPFERLVEELETGRDPSHNPLFQVFFALHNVMNATPPHFYNLEAKTRMVAHNTVKFDLSIGMWESSEGLSGYIDYNTDLFKASTIERMSSHFQTLLTALLASPDQAVSTLPLLTEHENQQMLVDWNATTSDYPRDASIPQLFAEHVAHTPNAIAVVGEKETLTYAELDQQANKLADILRSMGVEPEVPVGICLERSPAMIVGLLAILKAGGAYAPFDPGDPRERLAFLFEDIGIKVLLTRKQFGNVLPSSQAKMLYIDAELPSIPPQEQVTLKQPAAENLAYIISTSGSTGQPKGVCVTHRNVIRLIKSKNVVSIDANDIFMQFTPMTFDVSTFEIWGSLLNGATLAVFPPQQPSLEELGQFIQNQKVTTLWLTSGLFHQLIETQAEKLQGVRQLVAGGDVLSISHVRKAIQDLPDCRIINGYGPTENTTFTCYALLTKETDLSRSVPIGRPVSQTQIYLLDPEGQPVPIGIVGELHAGGDGVARGYLNRPELTAERFIKDPWHTDPHAKLYKTGDLARYLEDGTIEFLGRDDSQVKIRGFRVEPGEVESVLRQHSAVQQALVLVLDDHQGDKRLIAYIESPLGSETARKDIRQFLESKLPNYMIPSAFIVLDSFPLTTTGKIDRAALPAPDPESGAHFIAPRNMMEAQIAGLFADLLDVHPVSVRDNFFELGGHSLSAMRLIGRLQKLFCQDVPLSVFFANPTVEHLTHYLYQKNERLPAYSLVSIQPHGSKPPFFFVHPASGTIFPYVRLASYMQPDQPIYAFEESFISSQWEPCDSVEVMAERYIELLLKFKPQGPYHLGGWSFGGLIAYEMARRLSQRGHEIALLAMIDTFAPLPEYHPPTEDDTSIISWSVLPIVFSWPDHPKGYLPPILPLSDLRLMSSEEQWAYITEFAVKINLVDTTEQVKQWIEIYKHHVRANQIYKPEGEMYAGTVSLLKMVMPDEMQQPSAHSPLGWEGFTTGQVEVFRAEGDHFGLMGAAGPILSHRIEHYINTSVEEKKASSNNS